MSGSSSQAPVRGSDLLRPWLSGTYGGSLWSVGAWYTPVVAEILRFPESWDGRFSGSFMVSFMVCFGLRTGRLSRPNRLDRQILKGGSLLECAK